MYEKINNQPPGHRPIIILQTGTNRLRDLGSIRRMPKQEQLYGMHNNYAGNGYGLRWQA